MKLIREKCCCFTGHRDVPSRERARLRERLREEIARLAGEGVTTFLAGGAVGFDTIAAQEVFAAQSRGLSQLRLVLVLPCLGQEARWSRWDAAVYRTMLRRADEVIYTGDVYTQGCMFTRNRYLVDHSAHCLCYLTKSGRGGTAYTAEYARKQGLAVINLAEGLSLGEAAEEQTKRS